MKRGDGPMYAGNAFRLGLFAANCSGGLTMTKAPERWDPSWDNNLEAARLADEAGLEFMLPVGRWHGYRGETDTEGTSFETIVWASGLLAATQRLVVFGTLHVAFVNPVFAAKQIVTADHIGKGRFGAQHRLGMERARVRHVRGSRWPTTTSAMPIPKNGSRSSNAFGPNKRRSTTPDGISIWKKLRASPSRMPIRDRC